MRTRYQQLVDRLQDNRWLAPLLVVGLVLTAIAGATDAVGRLSAYVRPAPELELLADEELQPRTLDVTIRNRSSDDAVITRISARVDSVINDCLARPLSSSATYVVPLRHEEGATGYVRIRHAIPAHGVDRFILGLGTDAVCMRTSFTIEYNRGRKLRFSHTF